MNPISNYYRCFIAGVREGKLSCHEKMWYKGVTQQ